MIVEGRGFLRRDGRVGFVVHVCRDEMGVVLSVLFVRCGAPLWRAGVFRHAGVFVYMCRVCILHDLQFVDAGRGRKRHTAETGS